jgi:nicotinate-nucleotide adenylyltransferase
VVGAGLALGVLGGTFNPPHVGHLALARVAADELGLERVLLMPANVAPHKLDAPDPGTRHRLRMCELLAAEDARLKACPIELKRPGPSYTVDTLRSIHSTEPSAELTLIVGADTARTLPSWREPHEVLGLARLAVAAREGTERQAVLDALGELDGAATAAFLTMAPVTVSSSHVRAKAAAGEPLGGLVPAAVERYIAAERLYAEREPATEGATR